MRLRPPYARKRRGMSLLLFALLCLPVQTQEPEVSPAEGEGLLPVPEYAGDFLSRAKWTGDWGGLRQEWASKGIFLDLDGYLVLQDVADGGSQEGAETAANLDYRMTLDLMRMQLVPGAMVYVRGQSRWGESVNPNSGLLLPVNTYSAFPFSNDPDGEVDFAITELNWVQFLSDEVGVLVGKITTMGSSNEFMGGAGRTQFMNFQFLFSAVLAQLSPYSTLAVGGIWMPDPAWTLNMTLMNLTDSSTTSGFGDIGEGATLATTLDYRGSLNELPGGGCFGIYYGFDSEFSRIGGLNLNPGNGIQMDSKSSSWAVSWNGWQYLIAEDAGASVDPGDGKQDLQGLGAFAQLGFADQDTNPVSWAVSLGLSGRGSFAGRDADTWGLAYFYNELQSLNLGPLVLEDSTSGLELYYDFALTGSTSLALDAQWAQGAFPSADDALILGLRMNVSL